jgi:TonB family protein
MEEVQPPELVEIVNNEGDQSFNLWQPGGNSTSGSGAHSELTNYLKELNRKIRRAWSPPRGQSRRAEILFRIKRSGTLALLRVLRSSGDPQADEAALQAITASSPFGGLPADYKLSYIDVAYKFNYTVDQLSEVTGGPVR